MDHPAKFTLIRHVLIVSVRAAMRRAVIVILILPLLIFAPPEGSASTLVEVCNELQKPRPKAGTWAFRYCEVKNSYIEFLAMGTSEAVIAAGAKIEDQRNRCLYRVLSGQRKFIFSPRDLKTGLDNMRKHALPKLIEHFGLTEGTRQYKARVRAFIQGFEGAILSFDQEQCDEEAVRAYTTRWPVLLK